MIEKFYTCVIVLNTNPDKVAELENDNRTRLLGSLGKVQETMAEPDEELENAMTEFIEVFESVGFDESMACMPKLRGMMPKSETAIPRQIVNDITIMTLERFRGQI